MTRLWRTPPFRGPYGNGYRDEAVTLPPFTPIKAVSLRCLIPRSDRLRFLEMPPGSPCAYVSLVGFKGDLTAFVRWTGEE